jgi:hypothetical protein
VMRLKEALAWLDNLAYQRENNAVVSLDLQDCRAIRTVLADFEEQPSRLYVPLEQKGK